MTWESGQSGNPSGRKNGKLTKRQASSVRSHIQATQLVKRLQGFVLGKDDRQTGKPIELTVAQVNAAKYLISQAIGSPPQEITGQVDVNVRAQVQSIVARVGEERARTALEVLAPGLLTFLPESEPIEAEVEHE